MRPLTVAQGQEWASAAEYFVRNGTLPALLDSRVADEIRLCPDEWELTVRLCAYALAAQSAPADPELVPRP